MKPTAEAFDNGERPVNVARDNIVWLDHNKTQLIESGAEGAAITHLYPNQW